MSHPFDEMEKLAPVDWNPLRQPCDSWFITKKRCKRAASLNRFLQKCQKKVIVIFAQNTFKVRISSHVSWNCNVKTSLVSHNKSNETTCATFCTAWDLSTMFKWWKNWNINDKASVQWKVSASLQRMFLLVGK